MSTTILEKHEHIFELKNEMPMYPRNPPKSIYKNTLITRGSFFAIGTILVVVLSFFPDIWKPLTYIPLFLILVSILGVSEALVKDNQNWRKENKDRVRCSSANDELMGKLVELNSLYKGRRDDSVMFRIIKSTDDFFVSRVWSRYIQKNNPTKKELIKGFGDDNTGGLLYINDNEGWSFKPEFLTPKRYKITVKRIQWEDDE